MILFVVTPPFRRHFRPRRPNDDVPIRPLIDVLLYWFCGAFGGLCGSIGIVALLAYGFVGDVWFDATDITVIAIMTALAPPLLWVAFSKWQKLNHGTF